MVFETLDPPLEIFLRRSGKMIGGESIDVFPHALEAGIHFLLKHREAAIHFREALVVAVETLLNMVETLFNVIKT